MQHAADLLAARIQTTSPVCVGLDPALDKLPEGVDRSAVGVESFCKGIIDAVSPVASCIKPQFAYFELLGWEGMRALWNIAEYAKKRGMIVIGDAKRGDIGTTAEAYAQAYLGAGSPFNFLTVNPYLGSDGVAPFVKLAAQNGKGVFVLVKTSNQSGGELQDLPVGDEAVHEHLAGLVTGWAAEHVGTAGLSIVGAVVGATYPEEMKYLRSLMPHCPFLIPGYGAQGGTAGDVKHGFLPDGTGAVVNASRSIIFASSKKDWKEAAQAATREMADALASA